MRAGERVRGLEREREDPDDESEWDPEEEESESDPESELESEPNSELDEDDALTQDESGERRVHPQSLDVTTCETLSQTTMSVPPAPMPATLESLRSNISSQTHRIKNSLNSLFRDFDDDLWKKFYDTSWGVDINSLDVQHSVERGQDSKAIDNLGIFHSIPSHCNVMIKPEQSEPCWFFDCEKIFVRSEYDDAERFAVSHCGRCRTPPHVLLVIGQPGIGSSFFFTSATTGC